MKAEKLNQSLAHLCQSLDHQHIQAFQVLNSQYAIIIPDCERQNAVEHGNSLIRLTESLSRSDANDHSGMPMTISIGVATISLILATIRPRRFTQVRLVVQRCSAPVARASRASRFSNHRQKCSAAETIAFFSANSQLISRINSCRIARLQA